jgi:hypothetical protein
MPDLEKPQSRSRSGRPRATSRSDRPSAPQLERLYSGRHLDDHSYYHHSDHHGYSDGDSLSTLGKDTDGSKNKDGRDVERDGDESTELGDGVPDERHLEPRGPPLAKETTTRSIVKPEFLVGSSHSKLG